MILDVGRPFISLGAPRRAGGGGGNAPFDPSQLSDLVTLNRVGADRAAGRLWQNAAKTTAATVANDPVRVETSPVATPVDWAAAADDQRPTLKQDGGVWYIETAGDDGLGTVGNLSWAAPMHAWIWSWMPAGTVNQLYALYGPDSAPPLIHYFGSGTPPDYRNPQFYGGQRTTVNAPDAQWFLIQIWREAGATATLHWAVGGTEGSVSSSSESAFTLAVMRKGGTPAFPGTRVAQWGLRSVAPTSEERALLLAAGPGA